MLFKTFSRKVVVVVPNEEDWKKRLELRKEVEGDDVPESIMLEMKGGLNLYKLGIDPKDLEPRAANCTRVRGWRWAQKPGSGMDGGWEEWE